MNSESPKTSQGSKKETFLSNVESEVAKLVEEGRISGEQAKEKVKSAALIETGLSDDPEYDARLFAGAGVHSVEETVGMFNEKKTEAPTSEEYKQIENSIATKRAELLNASTEKMMEIVAEIKQLENSKQEAYDAAYDEATAENIQRDEEAFARTYDEAVAENNQANEASLETVRIGKIDQSITTERQKLSGASVEDLSGIVARIRELEEEKINPKAPVEEVTPEAPARTPEVGAEQNEVQFTMPEAELNNAMDEIFSLNHQIHSSDGWYTEGVIPAHALEDAIQTEIRSIIGVPEGDISRSNAPAELIQINEELESSSRDGREYSFYDIGTPDAIKKIQSLNLSFTQRFGVLGKLQKWATSSDTVKQYLRILDSAKVSYEQYKKLTQERDQKINAVQQEVVARYGNSFLRNYGGTSEQWKKSVAAKTI